MKKLIVLCAVLNLCIWSSTAYGQFSKVWDGGLGGAGTDPPNLVRAWGVVAGFDLDNDGHKEFATYDGTLKRIHVWESDQYGNNVYNVVWHKDKEVAGASILNGGERSIMITDLDDDGNMELIMVWDAFHPDSTDGFNALEIYEHDPTSGDFLPQVPTHTYDPPRMEGGLIRLEFQSQALDVDNDGTMELILTHRGGRNIILSIISMPGKDFADPQWVVEYVDSTTTTDSTRYGKKVHSMTIGDLDGNDKNDMLVQLDGDRAPTLVYSVTDADSYTLAAQFDTSAYGLDYMGSAGKLAIANFNGGTNEVYIGARGGKVWVVDVGTDISTAFNEANFTLIADINLAEQGITAPPAGKPELRGGVIGDADNDGKPNLYITCRDPVEAIYDFEWVGGTTGDVTDPDNYVSEVIFRDPSTTVTVGFVSIAIGDLDGDGADHQDIVFTTGNGNEGLAAGIYMVEFDSTTTISIDKFSTFIPESFSLEQNYPNPFNPATNIVYDLHEAGDVKLVVYNVLGHEIRTLFSGFKPIGRHVALWDGKDNDGLSMTSGVYIYTLEAARFKESRKMVLVR